MAAEPWRRIAASQAGVITRAQLAEVGVRRWSISHRIEKELWRAVSSTVIATTNGELSVDQRRWAALLHAGTGALLGGLTAAEIHGLQHWHRDEITVYIPLHRHRPDPLEGARFVASRRDIGLLRATRTGPPVCRVEPSALLFASAEPSERTALGALAATVQQRLTTARQLLEWVDRLSPLKRAPLIRVALTEMEGGVQSAAELDVKRLCRAHGLAPPERQRRRRDADGRLRFTDCEWRLPSGRTLVLEVDGSFHMSTASWEDDLERQRALTATGLVVIRCTSRELRDHPESVARHLSLMGVPCVRERGQ